MTEQDTDYVDHRKAKIARAREAAALVRKANARGRKRALKVAYNKPRVRNHKAKARSARAIRDLYGSDMVASWFELGGLRKARVRSHPMQQGRGRLLTRKLRVRRLAKAAMDSFKRAAAKRASQWLNQLDGVYAKADRELSELEMRPNDRTDHPRDHLHRTWLNELLNGQELGLFDTCQEIGKQPWVQLEGDGILAPIRTTIVKRELQWDGETEVKVFHPIMKQYRQQRYWNGCKGGYAL